MTRRGAGLESAPVGTIRVLDDHLINRIAAGEVVERPASVVKELVENSLDAGARRVRIALEAGGRSLVRVGDDGVGMDRDDALLALERHATSKLSGPAALSAIATLGFRGEALPSIAAVTRLILRTSPTGEDGTEVELRGGRILAVRTAPLPRGTTVEAAGLFFNVPARRKFLRAPATELAHVARYVTRCALARPEVAFLLEHEGRVLLDAPPTADPAARARAVLGTELADRLIPVEAGGGGLRITGLVGRPADARTGRDAQHLFVNGRVVSDRLVLHAVAEGYRNTVPRDRHPVLVLFLEVDPAMVDVNVHPQKHEVRFADGRRVHDAVRDAVAGVLSHGRTVPAYADLRPRPEPWTVAEPAPRGMLPAPEPPRPLLAEETADLPRHRYRVLAQYRDSYVVAEDEGGLVLVDQHAAHERVIFEQLLAQAERNDVDVQSLLFPVGLELDAAERATLEAEQDELRRLGFVLADAPGGPRLAGVPALAGETDPRALLRAVLGEAASVRSAAAGVGEARRRLVTTAACKAAITIHTPVAVPALQRLLDDLGRTANPTTCPHGRPVLFRLPLGDLERAFRRA